MESVELFGVFMCCISSFLLGLTTMFMGTPFEKIQGWSVKIVWMIVSILYIGIFFWVMNNQL